MTQYRLDQITEDVAIEQALIPFSIEKWESGKYTAAFRNGEAVKSIAILDVIRPVIAVSAKDRYPYVHHADGRLNTFASLESEYDLFLRPKETKVYINLYNQYDTLESAKANKVNGAYGVICITNGAKCSIVHQYNNDK